MEVGGHPGRIGLKSCESLGDGVQERQHNGDTDDTIDQITDRKPSSGRIARAATLQDRIDRTSEVGTEDERQCRHGGNEMRVGERHDEQHDRSARMGCPGQRSRNQDAQYGLPSNRPKQRTDARNVFGRG